MKNVAQALALMILNVLVVGVLIVTHDWALVVMILAGVLYVLDLLICVGLLVNVLTEGLESVEVRTEPVDFSAEA